MVVVSGGGSVVIFFVVILLLKLMLEMYQFHGCFYVVLWGKQGACGGSSLLDLPLIIAVSVFRD